MPHINIIQVLLQHIQSTCLFFSFSDVPFPKMFLPTAKKILTRLFRVFVHVYIHHFDKIQSLGAVSVNHKSKYSELQAHQNLENQKIRKKSYSTTSLLQPVFQNTKSFHVKSLQYILYLNLKFSLLLTSIGDRFYRN